MAIDDAAGSQIGDPLKVGWRGIKPFSLCAVLLLATLFTFVALVECEPIYRVPAYTDAQGGLVRLSEVSGMAEATHVVVKPEAGMAALSPVARGQSMLVRQTPFTFAPRGDALSVRFLVPARAAGIARAGMRVKIVFQDYPHQKFGSFDAQIEHVSTAPLMPAELPQMFAAQGPAYVAVASLPRSLRGPDGKPLIIQAGMLADALVPMERRSMLAWMLESALRKFNTNADPEAWTQGVAR